MNTVISTVMLELAKEIYFAARHDVISSWAKATNEWCGRGLDQSSGTVEDAVNALRAAWWHDGSDDARTQCRAAIRRLGEVIDAGV